MFSKEESVDAISLALLGYCEEALFPLVTERKDLIRAHRSVSMKFNARVIVGPRGRYDVVLNDGIVASVLASVRRLDTETINDAIDDIAAVLLVDIEHRDTILRGMVLGTVFFVLMHEAAHITCGHLDHAMQQQQHVLGASEAPFGLDEVSPTAEERQTGMSGDLGDGLLSLEELEADAIGFNLINGLAYELLTADEEMASRIKSFDSAEGVPSRVLQKASELMFYASCLAIALIHVERGKAGSYPHPFTRILGIGDMFLQTLVSLEQVPEERRPGIAEVPLDRERRSAVEDIAIPSFFTAIEICEACCDHDGYDLASHFGWQAGDGSVPKNLTMDFLRLSQDVGDDELLTFEARELRRLRELYAAFSEEMRPFRPQLSYRRFS